MSDPGSTTEHLNEKIGNLFSQHIQTIHLAQQSLCPTITQTGQLIAQRLLNGHKILCAGNGGSACDAQHFSAELVNRYREERPSLPAIALTADMAILSSIANDYHYDEVFTKQIRALGQNHDVFIAITTSGQSNNLIQAVQAAHDRQLTVIALTGRQGGELANRLTGDDIEIRVPSTVTAHIQECHIVILHMLCELIDCILFGYGD